MIDGLVDMGTDGVNETILLLWFWKGIVAICKRGITVHILPVDGLYFLFIDFFGRNFFSLKKPAGSCQQQEWNKKKEVLHFRKLFYF